VPFVIGGAERLTTGLVDAINTSTPHVADVIKLPSREHSLPDLMETYRSFSALDLSHFDLVVSGKYPAWMVRHPCHVVYMLHTLRGLYDTYGHSAPVAVDTAGIPILERLLRCIEREAEPAEIFDVFFACLATVGPDHPVMTFPGPLARLLVHRLDEWALQPAHIGRYLAISSTVARRPGYFPAGVDVGVAITPSSLTGFRDGPFGDFFTASRLDGAKRIDLLIGAMSHVDAPTRLVIAGNGPDRPRLEQLAAGDPRIVFAGFVSDDQLVDHYADALAVPFVPLDEDLGLITLEAQRCGKPVITCVDSGGPTELVENGISGWVVEPTPVAIGGAMARLVADVELARHLGDNGRRSAETHTWDRVVQAILAPIAPGPASSSAPDTARPATGGRRMRRSRRVVVLSDYPFDVPLGGGQLRCKWLLSELASRVDVHVIALDSARAAGDERTIAPGLTQTVVPRSTRQRELEAKLAARAPIPITDIADALYATETVGLVRAAAEATRDASVVVLAQPYLGPIADLVAPDVPRIYDAQNAEHHLKDQVLGVGAFDDELREVVRGIESDVVRSADLITYCSTNDLPLLESLGPTLADWALVPNGTDIAGTPFTTGAARSERRDSWLRRMATLCPIGGVSRVALFVASYHPPNNQAAEEIVRMALHLPHVLFLHVGSHCLHLDSWILPPNVLLAGTVPLGELRHYLSLADVALNPMITGGGTNLKLLEAFAAGVPVVATALGARGIDVEGGRELLVADVADFLEAMERTFDEKDTGRRVHNARRLVERQYDWEVLGTVFRAAVLPVLNA
jgi:glycosyltransferase involved in cell wall biosynthesis